LPSGSRFLSGTHRRANVATRKNEIDEKWEPEASARAKAAAGRAEVVEILAGAIFTMLLKGHVPPARAEGAEQLGECS